MELADELLSADYVGHDENDEEDVRGPEGAKQQISMYRGAFPDMTATVESQEDEGESVTSSWKVVGTHDGDLMGIAPTGTAVEISGRSTARVSGGRIVEEWHEWDRADLLRQVGATPDDLQSG